MIQNLHIATVKLRSMPGSVYQPGKAFTTEKPDKMKHDEFDKQYWRERAHYLDDSPDAPVIVPGLQFKKALESASAYNPKVLKGQKTYNDIFERSILVTAPLITQTTRKTVECEAVYVPSDGTPSVKSKGKSSRVWRRFPTIKKWEGEVVFHILDERLTEDVFRKALEDAGMFIGIGTHRPEKRGLNGRFEIVSFKWEKAGA